MSGRARGENLSFLPPSFVLCKGTVGPNGGNKDISSFSLSTRRGHATPLISSQGPRPPSSPGFASDSRVCPAIGASKVRICQHTLWPAKIRLLDLQQRSICTRKARHQPPQEITYIPARPQPQANPDENYPNSGPYTLITTSPQHPPNKTQIPSTK